MQVNASGETQPSKKLSEIISDFREVKHNINNSLGVIMALCELAEKKPESLTKLKDVVLTRTPDMVRALQKLADDLQCYAASHPES